MRNEESSVDAASTSGWQEVIAFTWFASFVVLLDLQAPIALVYAVHILHKFLYTSSEQFEVFDSTGVHIPRTYMVTLK